MSDFTFSTSWHDTRTELFGCIELTTILTIATRCSDRLNRDLTECGRYCLTALNSDTPANGHKLEDRQCKGNDSLQFSQCLTLVFAAGYSPLARIVEETLGKQIKSTPV